jgi:phage tail protein X
MQTDTNLIFTGGNTGPAQAITGTAVRSTGILDLATGLMNTGVTYAASPLSGGNYLINTSLLFSEDLGPGALRLRLAAIIGTAFSGGVSLNIQIQGAVDASAGAYPANLSGLTWMTYAETGAIPVADLGIAAAASVIPSSSIITLPDWPERTIFTAMPRFISLNYVPAGTFGAGALSFAGMMLQKPNFGIGQYVGGFSIAP